MTIFLRGNVPSSKNSRIYTDNGVFFSKTTQKYLRMMGIKGFSSSKKIVDEYKRRPNLFREYCSSMFENIDEYPIILGLHFVRESRRRADFHNLSQIILDLLVAHDFIDDDDMSHVFVCPLIFKGKLYTHCPDDPGVFISVKKFNIDEIRAKSRPPNTI